jgi:polyhydroxyalkanoate synthesis regulator phasin
VAPDRAHAGREGYSSAGDEETIEDEPMNEQQGQKRSAREKMSEGIRQGIGVLSAFKDALEETIQEARERGDLSSDRAKGVMKDALAKAQSAADDARERFDFVQQKEFDRLRETVEELRARLAALEEQVLAPGSSTADEAPDAGAP